MNPGINNSSFGSITVDWESFDHDIIITLEGKVEKTDNLVNLGGIRMHHKGRMQKRLLNWGPGFRIFIYLSA